MNNNKLKYISNRIIFTIIILIVLICILLIIFFNYNKNENSENQTTNQQQEVSIETEDELEDDYVLYELTDNYDYDVVCSVETYIQKYFEQNGINLINNFYVFNSERTFTSSDIMDEEYFYVLGYVCNKDFSEIKEIIVEMIVNFEDDSYKIEVEDEVNLETTTFDDFITQKQEELGVILEQQVNIEDEETDIENEEIDEEFNEEIEEEDEELYNENEEMDEELDDQYNSDEFRIIQIEDKYLAQKYYLNFKIKVLSNSELSYNFISNESKNNKFKNVKDYKDNIGQLINNQTTITNYQTVIGIENDNDDDELIYKVKDDKNTIFTININNLNEYNITIE